MRMILQLKFRIETDFNQLQRQQGYAVVKSTQNQVEETQKEKVFVLRSREVETSIQIAFMTDIFSFDELDANWISRQTALESSDTEKVKGLFRNFKKRHPSLIEIQICFI